MKNKPLTKIMTFCSRIKDVIFRIIDTVTIEPIIFLFSLVRGFQMPTDQALWYRKVCMIEYQDEWICDNLDTNATYEDHVQSVNSQWDFYNTFCFNAPALIITFLYGSWSDKISRKIPIVLPIVGTIVGCMIYMCSSFNMESPLGFLLLAGLIQGILGGTATQLMATMSYVTDVCAKESRTFRISIVYASSSTGYFLSYTMSGVLYEATGFIIMYSICIIISLISLIYVTLGLQDIKPKESLDTKENLELDSPKKSKVRDLCNLDHMKDAILVTFKPRPNGERKQIIVIVTSVLCVMMGSCYYVTYLYLKGAPLSFSQSLYGYYQGYSTVIHCSCLFIVVPILKNRFKLSDTLLLIIAMISSIANNLMYAFSVEVWMVFLVPIVGYMNAALFTFLRGVISSIVKVDELGKIFAVIATLENLGGLVASALYNYFLYPATVDIFAGFCYVFASFILIIPLCLSMWLHISMNKKTKALDEVYIINDETGFEDNVVHTMEGDRY